MWKWSLREIRRGPRSSQDPRGRLYRFAQRDLGEFARSRNTLPVVDPDLDGAIIKQRLDDKPSAERPNDSAQGTDQDVVTLLCLRYGCLAHVHHLRKLLLRDGASLSKLLESHGRRHAFPRHEQMHHSTKRRVCAFVVLDILGEREVRIPWHRNAEPCRTRPLHYDVAVPVARIQSPACGLASCAWLEHFDHDARQPLSKLSGNPLHVPGVRHGSTLFPSWPGLSSDTALVLQLRMRMAPFVRMIVSWPAWRNSSRSSRPATSVEIPAWREHRIVFACHLCFDGNKRVGDEIEGTAGARRGERSGHALENSATRSTLVIRRGLL